MNAPIVGEPPRGPRRHHAQRRTHPAHWTGDRCAAGDDGRAGRCAIVRESLRGLRRVPALCHGAHARARAPALSVLRVARQLL